MPPFQGPTCADQDPCQPNPCQNGGQCMAMGNSYQCRCQTGFMGRNCDQADICGVRSPCLCGTCQNDPMSALGFKCHCPPGVSGQRCERLLNCLDPGFECRNGGHCIPRVLGDYVCSCPQPWCGATCTNKSPSCTNTLYASVKAGDCSASNCNNRGVCVSRKSGGFECFCSTGWKGSKCESQSQVAHLRLKALSVTLAANSTTTTTTHAPTTVEAQTVKAAK